jgi:3-isopropylmalate/(R)-2-methylmalate dehydratase small subunit
MKPFRIHTGLAVALEQPNIDTDQIIPKQFLKRIERTGFGKYLFYDWRFKTGGDMDDAFILNEPRYQGATIMLAGRNFGCGSSREHAPWALLDYGFRAIIAPSFADIFANNCMKNGIVPVVLTEEALKDLARRSQETAGYSLTVNLERCVVQDATGFEAAFVIEEFRRACLLEGLDDIGLTFRYESQVASYEQTRARWQQNFGARVNSIGRQNYM